MGNTLTRWTDKHTILGGPVEAERTFNEDIIDDAENVSSDVDGLASAQTMENLVQRLVAHVRAVHTEPQPFIGLADQADALIDVEIDGVRCILLVTPPDRPSSPILSPRELEIARMVTKGLPNKSIANVLQISIWTVSSHMRRVFTKLGVNSRAEMVVRLLEEGCLNNHCGSL